jgi:hypothetical protein
MTNFDVIIQYGNFLSRTKADNLNHFLDTEDFRQIIQIGHKIILHSARGTEMSVRIKEITHTTKSNSVPYHVVLDVEIASEGSYKAEDFDFYGSSENMVCEKK